MKRGFIYILSNNSLKENLLKIGKTSKKTVERTKQLSSSTSIPENFQIEEEFEFSDINWAEKEVHSRLLRFRYNKRKEFFKCEINVAKQIIIEVQIEDKKREISALKNDLKSVKDILNNSEFLKFKWKAFLIKLKWNFIESNQSENSFSPDFILDTKVWEMGPNGEEVFKKESYIYVYPEFSKKLNDYDLPAEIKELIELSRKDVRLIIVDKQPIEESEEIIFGWEYIFKTNIWEKRKFIKTENNFGLFDEDRTWFDIVNGNSVKRNGLYPNKSEIMKLWNE